MPFGDGSGPFGEADWPCRRGYGTRAGFGTGYGGMRRGFRRGRGRGFGGGYGGYGRRFYAETPLAENAESDLDAPATLTKDERRKILEAELVEVEAEKNALEKTLKELKKENKGKK